MKLLVVDDNDLSREMTQDVVTALGIEAIGAGGGQEALEILSRRFVDAVLMDYMMPGMDGAQTTLKIHEKKNLENLPVIAMTAEEEPSTVKILLEAGMLTVLHKPVEPLLLYKILSEMTSEELIRPEVPSMEGIAEDERLVAMEGLGFEVAGGIKFVGNVASYNQYALDFAHLLPEMLDEIATEMQLEDYKNFTVNIHGLKSNFRVLGHTKFYKSCLEMEELGKAEKYEELKRIYPERKEQLDRCSKALEEIFENKEQLIPFSSREFTQALRELKDALKTFDLDTADVIVRDLKTRLVEGIAPEQIRRLCKEVAAIHYGKALDIIEVLLAVGKGGQSGE